MLPESYFNGERLAAYLSLLQEFSSVSHTEVQQREVNTPVIIVNYEEDIQDDSSISDNVEILVTQTSALERVTEGSEKNIVKEIFDVSDKKREVSLVSDISLEEFGDDSHPLVDIRLEHRFSEQLHVNVALTEEEIDPEVYKRGETQRLQVRNVWKLRVRNGHWSKEIYVKDKCYVIFNSITSKINQINLLKGCYTPYGIPSKGEIKRVDISRNLEGQIKRTLFSKIGYGGNQFPGVEFSGLTRRRLKTLKRHKFFCARKIDGERHLLMVHNTDAFFLARSMAVTMMSENLYVPNMVLDGEIYKGIFVVFDVLSFGDNNLTKMTLIERIGYFRSLETTLARQNNILFLQEYGTSDKIEKYFWQSSEGVVLIPGDLPYEFGYSRYLHKFKKGFDTIDLLVDYNSCCNKMEYKYVVYTGKRKTYNYFCDADASYDRRGTIVEVKYESGQWRFFRDRPDKKEPNVDWVVKEIVREVSDPVTIEDVKKHIGMIFN